LIEFDRIADMKCFLVVVLVVATSMIAAAQQPAPAPLPSVELPPELSRVLRDYESAWQKRDAAALSQLFAEDGFVMGNGSMPVRGRAAIAAFYAGQGGPLSLRAIAFATDGSAGYILGGFAGAAGQPDAGKFTLTLRKGGDGRWLIVSDMDNPNARRQGNAWPLVIGDTFTMESKLLGETRRINVYLPPGYADAPDSRFPVLYMPDGGTAEDFIHVAGLIQVGVGNGTMRPFVLVGIENTQRRRDLSGPTENAEDKKIAPVVGGSAKFRSFIREELMPQVKTRYRTTSETAIVGESLAGLFVVETFLLEPDLFDTYIAFDPSLWWNDHKMVDASADRLRTWKGSDKTLYLATSGDGDRADATAMFAGILAKNAPATVHWQYEKMPDERHSTIYHPAALRAFRTVFRPKAE